MDCSDKERQSTRGNIMKKLFILSILALTFNANAKVIKGINLNQKYKCVVSKVHNQPNFSRFDKHNIKPGAFLIDQETNRPIVTLQDLVEDYGFMVDKWLLWHYQALDRAAKTERLCKSTCLIYRTPRVGRWTFLPQRNGTMNLNYDYTVNADIRVGKKGLSFKCTKASRR